MLTSTSGTKTCNFIAYDYSHKVYYCNHVTIISGTVKYTVSVGGSDTYCVVSAFSDGHLDIDSDGQTHFSFGVDKTLVYDKTESDQHITNPVITYVRREKHMPTRSSLN